MNDGLTDVFCLLLAEHFHRSVIVDSNSPAELTRVINMYGDQLLTTRLRLKDRLLVDLGEMTEWTAVAGQLVAVAFLGQQSIEELLQVYLDARQVGSFVPSSFHSLSCACSKQSSEISVRRR